MPRVTVRLTNRMSDQLDTAAAAEGVNRARYVRKLIAEAVKGTPVIAPNPPTEEELLELLAEKARQGNVAAIRSLLAREAMADPRARALEMFTEMALERQP